MKHAITRRQSDGTWILTAFLCFLFLVGGASRHDVASLPYLRIGCVLFAGVAAYRLQLSTLRPYRYVIYLLGAYTAWLGLQLVPVPPSIWTEIPGRELVVRSAQALGIEQPWRPISLVPWRTLNALLAMVIPWTTLLLTIQAWVDRNQQRLVIAIIGIGLVSGVLGLFQMLGPDGGFLYFYDITNDQSAVGLFSNRNHNAAFLACCIPLVAYVMVFLAQSPKARLRRSLYIDAVWISGPAIAFVLLVSILATGSRAGMLVGAVSFFLSGVVLLIKLLEDGKAKFAKLWPFVMGFIIVTIALIGFGLLGQSEAAERLQEFDQSEELRLRVWGPIARLIGEFAWTGSGVGTFVEVYEMNEPSELISEQYLNHAHNDWLEIAVTGGVPAIVILIAGVALYFRLACRAWLSPRGQLEDRVLARVAAIDVGILGLFSIGDYPLRTPSLSGFFIISVLWLVSATRKRRADTEGARTNPGKRASIR